MSGSSCQRGSMCFAHPCAQGGFASLNLEPSSFGRNAKGRRAIRPGNRSFTEPDAGLARAAQPGRDILWV